MFSYILRNMFSMDAKMYSKMPTEFFFGSSDCLLYVFEFAKSRFSNAVQLSINLILANLLHCGSFNAHK